MDAAKRATNASISASRSPISHGCLSEMWQGTHACHQPCLPALVDVPRNPIDGIRDSAIGKEGKTGFHIDCIDDRVTIWPCPLLPTYSIATRQMSKRWRKNCVP